MNEQDRVTGSLSRTGTGLACLIGLGLVFFFLRDGWHNLVNGRNDFLPLYTSTRLLESSQLYYPGPSLAAEMEAAGFYSEAWIYNRLPFDAVLLWPLGKLPYRQALKVWLVLSVAALVGFILAWNATSRNLAVLACCWSLPLMLGIEEGQDLTLLLLVLAVSLRTHSTRPFLAGALQSLCSIKFHLFILLPLLIVGQRRWRMLFGLLAGGFTLTALSFAAAGADWPRRYFELLIRGSNSPMQQIMPNLHAMLLGVPYNRLIEPLLGAVTGIIVWLIARRADFAFGLAAALTGGLLVSHHAYPQDCTLLIPALLVVISRSDNWLLNYLCIALFTPWPYLRLLQGDQGNLVRLAISTLLVGMIFLSRGIGSSKTGDGYAFGQVTSRPQSSESGTS